MWAAREGAAGGRAGSFQLNVRDLPERDELYLTYTGSSIESGDEGVVGRGNRVNGMITPLRPMSVEGASGKNPVYHVATGQRLDRPWRALIRLACPDPEVDEVNTMVLEAFDGFPALTDEILTTGLVLA